MLGDFRYFHSHTCYQIQAAKFDYHECTAFQEEFLKETRVVHLHFLFCGSSKYARNKMNALYFKTDISTGNTSVQKDVCQHNQE